MPSRPIGRALRLIPNTIVRLVARTRVHPNLLSAFGLVVNLAATAWFATGHFVPAGLAMLAGGGFDWLDGAVARRQGRASRFGEFLDSSFDCYSDLVLFAGLLVYYARVNRFLYAVLVCVAMAGTVMIGYARARSDSLVAHGDKQPIQGFNRGFWERPERIVLLVLGALTNRMAPVLWLLAVGPNLSVVATILRARHKVHVMGDRQRAQAHAGETAPGR